MSSSPSSRGHHESVTRRQDQRHDGDQTRKRSALGGFFSYASRFKIFGGNFYNITNYNHTGAEVRNLLAKDSLSDAELHSRARFPQPECLDGTRSNVLREIQDWISAYRTGVGCEAAWLYGPVGVGKSAIAQTLGLWAERDRRLGAAVFLSKAPGPNDPYRLFISIAQQLAQKNGVYAERIAQQLLDDTRSLTNLDLAAQFKKLFDDPFKSTGITFDQKPVVIIDGLDECSGDEEQSEIIRLIGRSTTAPQSFPLLWVLFTRPEPHIRRGVLQQFSAAHCKRQEIPLDDGDIRTFFSTSLRHIRGGDPYIFSSNEAWPPLASIEAMVRAAAGLFIYASTLIKFIADRKAANPKSQLKIVLDFISHQAPKPDHRTKRNPLQALDDLYIAVLSGIDRDVLALTLVLLGLASFHPQIPALQLAGLLDLDQGEFYAALDKVHAVVAIPLAERAASEHLRFYHSSFSDFLKDPSRSKEFALSSVDFDSEFIQACFRALGKTKLRFAKELPWRTTSPDVLTVSHRILSYAAKHVWAACVGISDDDTFTCLLNVISNFTFRQLIFVKSEILPSSLLEFAEWLSAQTTKHNYRPVVVWKEIDPYMLGENGAQSDHRCFMLGEGAKAVTIYLNTNYLSIVP